MTLKQSNLEGASGFTLVWGKKCDLGCLCDPAQVRVVRCVLVKHYIAMAGGWSMEEQ